MNVAKLLKAEKAKRALDAERDAAGNLPPVDCGYKTLNDGVQIPRFGLGCYQSVSDEAYTSVVAALRNGYRLIDTAQVYRNEADVGRGIRDSQVPREEIFLTTKFWPTKHGYSQVMEAFEESLKQLGVTYIDLYLIHSPSSGDPDRNESWRACCDLKAQGRARSIGVSNYGVHHLEELLQASEIKPSVNQIEVTPFLLRSELVNFCAKHEIGIEAYSPLTKGAKLQHPVVCAIGAAHKKTSAHVLLRWSIQKGYVVIPKSVKEERVIENSQIFDFELSASEMQTLDDLDENLVTGWDPTVFA
eukprot:c39325_g1_i1.p1 GENE.c39325_g1_i1~~c39325_g1_i1.p1  ORF type:complete len:310 (-),score=67.40 c39325_g1_i1:47-952(-)